MSNEALLVQNVTTFTIFSNYGEDLSLLGEGAFSHILIFQSIYDHSVRGKFTMFDSGVRNDDSEDTLSAEDDTNFCLTVGEKVELVVQDERQQTLEFTGGSAFLISEIRSASSDTMKEVHEVEMCMPDFIKNDLEENFVITRFDQKVSDTVNEVLTPITERGIAVDPTVTELPVKGNTERPLDFVTSLAPKAQSEKFPESAGYLLFDTYNGLNFRSIDVMFSQEPKRRMILTETAKLPVGYSNKILSVEFTNELNVHDSLKYGAFQKTRMRTFDPKTNQYTQTEHVAEDLYQGDNNLSESSPKVAEHLGISESTTRVLSAQRDTGIQPAGPALEEQLKSAEEQSFNVDEVPQLATKRYYQSRIFSANIKTYGDFQIFPGDVIHCDFPEIGAKQTKKSISQSKSGKYLVADVAHLVCPEGCYTKLNIIRDSVVCS